MGALDVVQPSIAIGTDLAHIYIWPAVDIDRRVACIVVFRSVITHRSIEGVDADDSHLMDEGCNRWRRALAVGWKGNCSCQRVSDVAIDSVAPNLLALACDQSRSVHILSECVSV